MARFIPPKNSNEFKISQIHLSPKFQTILSDQLVRIGRPSSMLISLGLFLFVDIFYFKVVQRKYFALYGEKKQLMLTLSSYARKNQE